MANRILVLISCRKIHEVLSEWLFPTMIDRDSWPYIMLCKDIASGDVTWHMLCDERNIPRMISNGYKLMIDMHISDVRKRNLQGIELFCRDGEHYFIH